MLFGSSFSHTRHFGNARRPSTGNVCVGGLSCRESIGRGLISTAVTGLPLVRSMLKMWPDLLP